MTRRDVYFTVEGEGEFPFDMLRYDGCHPATEPSSHKLNTSRDERREVVLTSRSRQEHWAPNKQRWERFGWSVKSFTWHKPNEMNELLLRPAT